MLISNKDALASELKYDQQLKRYRYIDSGKFVSRDAAINLQRDYLEQQTEKLIGLAARIKANEPGISKIVGEALKRIHVSNAIIAANGIDLLSPSDLGKIGNVLKQQYNLGRNKNTGEKFGIKYLLQDSPDISEAMIAQRLSLYAKSGTLSGNVIKESKALNSGKTREKRSLGRTDHHCAECIEYAARGWQPIGSLPKPKTACSCLANCLCTLSYGMP